MLALAALVPSIARRAICTGVACAAAGAVSQASSAFAAAPPDGLFPDCAPNGCVSSQDDRPAAWDNPWEYDGDAASAQSRLVAALTSAKFGGRVLERAERYVRADFDGGADVAEFYFTPNDDTVQFRAERRDGADFGANRGRLEKLRIACGWEKLPVLRNRRRTFIVGESPFDSFGPAMYDRDELGFTQRNLVPAEANQKEMYGDLDPRAAPWRKPDPASAAAAAADRGERGFGARLDELVRSEADDRVRSR